MLASVVSLKGTLPNSVDATALGLFLSKYLVLTWMKNASLTSLSYRKNGAEMPSCCPALSAQRITLKKAQIFFFLNDMVIYFIVHYAKERITVDKIMIKIL